MKNFTLYLLAALFGLLVIIGMLILLIRDTTLKAVEPIQKANSVMGTEIAKVLHPTPTILPDPVTIIHEVQALARLETIQYSVEKVITGDSGQALFKPLFGDKLLFVAHGTVIAGVDLNKLSPSDMFLENGILKIRLPEAEIFSAGLNNDKSFVFDRQTGIFTRPDPSLETQVRRLAEQEIYKAAIADGILAQAQVNAETYVTRLLHDLGFKNVVIVKSIPK